MRGLKKIPWYHRKVMWVVRNLKNKNKRKKRKNMRVRIGSSRIVDFVFSVPPSLPMVSLLHSYVRAVRMPQSGWGFDGGRIANLAVDEPDCHSAG